MDLFVTTGYSGDNFFYRNLRNGQFQAWTSDEVGDVLDVIMIGDDLAGQKGPLFRPEFYRRVADTPQRALDD